MIRSIWLKELKVIWASPLPYALGAAFHATLGVLGHGQLVERGQAVFQPIVPIAGFLLLLSAPVLCARTLAEESRSGSLELLLAVPVPVGRLVTGKYLAALTTLLALVAPTALFAVLLSVYADPDPGPVIAGMAGLALMAVTLTGVGVLASSLTSSQPVAALGGLFAVLALWFAHAGSDALAYNDLIGAMSISERLRSFAGGVIDLSDALFFPSLALVALAAAGVAVSSRRWR